MRLRAAVLALFLVIGIHLLAPAAAAAGLDVPAAEAQFVELINADRLANGVPPLVVDPRLMDVARWRSEDMVARNFFAHDVGGFYVGQVLRERQVSFALAGENLAVNTYDDARTVAMAQTGLMASTSHRANVLRPEFTLVGVGIATGTGNRTVYTQIFVQG